MKFRVWALLSLLSFNLLSLKVNAEPGDITADAVNYPVHIDPKSNLTIDFDVEFKLKKEVEKVSTIQETNSIPTCSDAPVHPSQGDWKNYWNEADPTIENRAQSLVDAIKGMDYASALMIARHGLLVERPKFWSEFVNAMGKAEHTLRMVGFNAQFFDLVTVKYASINVRSLGFWSDSNCRLDKKTRQIEQTSTVFEPAGTQSRHYSIRVVQPILQSFEQDDFKLHLGLKPRAIDSDSGQFNRYDIEVRSESNEHVLLTLTPERILVNIPSEALSGSLKIDGASFVASLSIDSKYLPQNDPGSTLMLYYEVCSSWFFGCRSLEETGMTVPMTTNKTTVRINGNFDEYLNYRIRYRFYRTPSKFYSENPASTITNKILYKKIFSPHLSMPTL